MWKGFDEDREFGVTVEPMHSIRNLLNLVKDFKVSATC